MVTTSLGIATLSTAFVTGVINHFSPASKFQRNLLEILELAKVEIKISSPYKEKDITLRPIIKSCKKTKYGFDAVLELPKGYGVEKFREKIQVIEQGTGATQIQVKHLMGRQVKLKIGMLPIFERMDFNESLIVEGSLKVPYYTPYGVVYLDFEDESTCHLIVAGATRMGKSVFLRLLFTVLTLETKGNIQFYYINNKKADYQPLKGVIPEPAVTIPEAHKVLEKVYEEIARRIEILDTAGDSVNIKQYRSKHSDIDVPPVFIVFDEYGRFAEDDSFQDAVQEIAETAGYLDIHIVIATQRPDATTVLKPRIRANILSRVCFQTADEANSKIVVHTDDAAHLDSVRGRAVVLDGMPGLGQIPYISEEQTQELLSPFRREIDVKRERPEDIVPAETLPRFVTEPTFPVSLSKYSEALGNGQQNYEKAGQRRTHHNHKKAKG